MTAPERFWSKVAVSGPDECWLWQASTDEAGYGSVRWGGRTQPAHRVAYLLSRGTIPDGLFVLHSCDTPGCCNPNHLHPGTQKQNVAECLARGRFPSGDRNGSHLHPESRARGERNGCRRHPECVCRGEKNAQAKLTRALAVAIRQLYSQGTSAPSLASQYGVSCATIYHVVHFRTWME
jgi:hypothetical protein